VTWVVRLSVVAIGFAISACTSAATAAGDDTGVRELSSRAVAYEGPELQAAVGFHHAAHEIGAEYMILMIELAGPRNGAQTEVDRTAISLRGPDGLRYILLTQIEYREVYGKLNMQIRRTLSASPPLAKFGSSRRPCGDWFLRSPGDGVARDVLYISSHEMCSGVMVFYVPGGIQPGRRRLVIDLEESRADMPFVLDAPRWFARFD